ncbi:MAG: protease inhibitor I42 family protein [Syntrophobacteraceae bacterium]
MIVNKAFNGKEIELRAGEIIRIELEELGTAGYVWEIMNLDSDHFEVLKVATKDRSRPGIVGAPVLKVWLIRAKEPGKCELKFLCYRPWECEANAADTFLLKVRIL